MQKVDKLLVKNSAEFVLVAGSILQEFDSFYIEFLEVPEQAKVAFENRDFVQSIKLSANRLHLYSNSIQNISALINQRFPGLVENETSWISVEAIYRRQIENRYAGDLALAYFHSVRRKLYKSEWRTEDYSILRQNENLILNEGEFIKKFVPLNNVDVNLVLQILRIQNFTVEYLDIYADAERIVKRLKEKVNHPIDSVEMFDAGFYRNRGAYLVGRIKCAEKIRPFIIALLNSDKGLYVDALITSTTFAHNMFSSTLANFHVTTRYYHELCLFLKNMMPKRPLGLHYSTIGYNHLGKVAVMNEIESEITLHHENFKTAIGMKGTVAIGFSTDQCSYCLKVIRNTPTSGYKWGEFEGIESVLAKYKRVHDINRTDSMLDSIIYYNLRLSKSWFDQALLDELLEFAGESVINDGQSVIFRYLIVQRKLTPLPVFLESASETEAEKAIINLGYCIKNNLAANIFNKDLDVRNYGITTYSKVYLFDYDALEDLVDVKIRTNQDRFDGEEDIPEWFFETGVVFLPEEIIAGLCLPYRNLRNKFSDYHHQLLSMGFWEDIQQELLNGTVPSISVYPDSEKLH